MSKETVIVGCKLPHGLKLELGYDPVTGIRGEDYQFVVVKGANQFKKPGEPATGEGVGLTTGVDKAFWDEWLKRNKTLQYVREGLLFAQPEMKSAESAKREVEKERTGMEPLEQNDGRAKDVRNKIRPYSTAA
jgi:hypothetical protein